MLLRRLPRVVRVCCPCRVGPLPEPGGSFLNHHLCSKMRFTVRRVLIGLVAAVVLAAAVIALQQSLRRVTQPSVQRDVQIVNTSQWDIFVVVVRPETRVVVPPVSVPANQQTVLHVYSGESTSEFDRTEFIFVAWSADRVSRSLVLSGLEIDARNGRIEFGDFRHDVPR